MGAARWVIAGGCCRGTQVGGESPAASACPNDGPVGGVSAGDDVTRGLDKGRPTEEPPAGPAAFSGVDPSGGREFDVFCREGEDPVDAGLDEPADEPDDDEPEG